MKFSLSKPKPLRLLIIALVTVAICKLVFIPFRTCGLSMQPTYRSGQFCFANRLAYLSSPPQRGDIVVIHSNERPKPRYLLKRIIALPNETIEIRKGRVYINEKYYQETYAQSRSDWNMAEIELDTNHYYVIGDNRAMPIGEHMHLKVHRKNILGKIFP